MRHFSLIGPSEEVQDGEVGGEPADAAVLEISSYSKGKLIYEYLFECRNVVLFVEYEHCLFVINRINCSE